MGRNWGDPFLFNGNRVNGEYAGRQIRSRSSADQKNRSTKSEVESSNLAGATNYRERSITGQGKNIGGASQYFTPTLQKPEGFRVKASDGEVVVLYFEPSATQNLKSSGFPEG